AARDQRRGLAERQGGLDGQRDPQGAPHDRGRARDRRRDHHPRPHARRGGEDAMTQFATLEYANGVPKPLPQPPVTYRNYIGGKWREARADRSTPNTNPADTRQVLGQVPHSAASDVRDAVQARHAALPAWRETPAPVRGRILYRLVELMERHRAELATILTLEEGKTFGESMGEVAKSINVVEFYAGEGRRIGGETPPSERPGTFCYTVRQPLGVVAVITPGKFPTPPPLPELAPARLPRHTGRVQ